MTPTTTATTRREQTVRRRIAARRRMTTLYHHEAEFVRDIVDGLTSGTDVILESATGSGKTLMAVVSLRLLLGFGLTHALIIAPQEQIEEGFVAPDGGTIAWPKAKRGGIAHDPVVIGPGFVRQARGEGRSSVAAILAYLRSSDPGHALACTHAALVAFHKVYSADLPASLAGMVLVVDEAHHAPANKLSGAVDAWTARGGRRLYLTATAHRADGRPVATGTMTALRRSIDEQMEDGLAPRNWIHAIEAIGHLGDLVTAAIFRGDATITDPIFIAEVARRMVKRWLEDGRVKVIVRVPPMNGGTEPLVQAILAAFDAAGANTLDATGTEPKDKRRVLAALASERGRTFAESSYDVVVGCQRIVEGSDWPLCSTVYCLGIPGSLPMIAQLSGRATRKKPASYPMPEREIAKIVFFVPNAGGEALDKLSADQNRHALLACVYLANREVAESWIMTKAVRAGTGDPKAEVATGLDPMTLAQAKAIMAAEAETRTDCTIGELVDAVRARMPEIDAEGLAQVAVGILAAGEGATERVRGAIAARAKCLAKVRPGVAPDMNGLFAPILEEFRAEQVGKARSLGLIAGLARSLTGRGMREWVGRMVLAVMPTDDEIVLAALEHLERTDHWPSSTDTAKVASLGMSWCALHHRLLTHKRVSLAVFLDRRCIARPNYRGTKRNSNRIIRERRLRQPAGPKPPAS